MDTETRAYVIGLITDYADHHNDRALLELVGWTPCSRRVTDAQAHAVIAAVLPLADDDQLNAIVRHIADSLLYQQEAA